MLVFAVSYITTICFLTLQDLFASAAKAKPKPNQAKASPLQPSKALSSSLFSDDEVWEYLKLNILLLHANL